MKRLLSFLTSTLLIALFLVSCQPQKKEPEEKTFDTVMKRKLANYAKVKLSADLTSLSPDQVKLLSHLITAAKSIDEIYWLQSYGDKEELLKSISDPDMKEYALINYGPWDRLDGLSPFTEDFPPRPLGSEFYPPGITQTDFFAIKDDRKYNPFTVIKQNEKGEMYVLPYHEAYAPEIQKLAEALNKASELAGNAMFKEYLTQRAKDFQLDDFTESDKIWMGMKNNDIDFVAGPIENYDDRFLWTKYSYGAMILQKDKEWSKKVERYSLLLPYLQKNLPVDEKYKQEAPGENSDIGVYDVLYNSGYCNAGGKFITLNLPIGDNTVGIGTRKLNFKNIVQAKFDKILKPISELVIDEKQRKYVKFDAFFLNTLFFEISNALGITQTINNKGSVKEALKEHNNEINMLKNDVLRMFFLTKLHEMRELGETDLMDNYVTYMAEVFRSMRFGVTNAQGVANMVRFYYFQENEAFTYNYKTGTYKVNFYKMKKAILALSEIVLMIQGNGDYETANKLITEKGFIRNELLNDLYRIQRAQIPKDLVFDQGEELMGMLHQE